MIRVLPCILTVGLLALVGCKQTTTTAPSTNPSKPEQARKLTITSPGEQKVVVNGTDKFTVRVTRDHFTGPVTIEVKNLPPGVSVVTPDMTIPADKDTLEVTVKANPDAKVGDNQSVQLVAHAKDQKDLPESAINFNMDVKPK